MNLVTRVRVPGGVARRQGALHELGLGGGEVPGLLTKIRMALLLLRTRVTKSRSRSPTWYASCLSETIWAQTRAQIWKTPSGWTRWIGRCGWPFPSSWGPGRSCFNGDAGHGTRSEQWNTADDPDRHIRCATRRVNHRRATRGHGEPEHLAATGGSHQ